MDYRIERDSMGEVKVPAHVYWGAQTQRSYKNFAIGSEKMPQKLVEAITIVKVASARANRFVGKLDEGRAEAIEKAGMEIIGGKLADHFPLAVWQTGSGTQTNMNVNEVIARRAFEIDASQPIHPNDHVNMSQSSNDVFPTAIHVAAVTQICEFLLPELEALEESFAGLETRYADTVKIGRTHLQDATPVSFGQEAGGWRSMMAMNGGMIKDSLAYMKQLALGGTAVGTGLNAPQGFSEKAIQEISRITGIDFIPQESKFHALSAKDAAVHVHGALKALAANLMKIANDIRWMASGPRCGLGELDLPANEPGSSIMPGKVNPTQCEAVTMIACQVMGNDTAIGIAASQGNFELNVYMPVCAYNLLQSIDLLAGGMRSFRLHCVDGIRVNEEKMAEYLQSSLMLVTALNPHLGYDNGAKIAKYAYEKDVDLKEAAVILGLLSPEEYDAWVVPESMI